jgi:dual specificity tyrosine-phosphorylation-regulated kinase 2/3/4
MKEREQVSEFDNTDKEYIYTHEGEHIAYRYEIIKMIGKGSFGQVYKCKDHREGLEVAVKVLMNKKRLFKQGLVERRILENLRENDPEDRKNCVRIIGSQVFRGHLLLVFELLSTNLYEFLKIN